MKLIKFVQLAEKSVLPLKNLLAQKTADDILKLFKIANIKAVIGDSKKCAIAAYLTHFKIKAEVTNQDITLLAGIYNDMTLKISGALTKFVNRFDDGKYPEITTPASLKALAKEKEEDKKWDEEQKKHLEKIKQELEAEIKAEKAAKAALKSKAKKKAKKKAK